MRKTASRPTDRPPNRDAMAKRLDTRVPPAYTVVHSPTECVAAHSSFGLRDVPFLAPKTQTARARAGLRTHARLSASLPPPPRPHAGTYDALIFFCALEKKMRRDGNGGTTARSRSGARRVVLLQEQNDIIV